MILTHLPDSWPRVLAGELTPEEATLGDWYNLADKRIEEYGDVVLGIYENRVVTAYNVTSWRRAGDRRVTFEGSPSEEWKHLIGTPNPGKLWGLRGMARPVQYLDTRIVRATTAPTEPSTEHQRATVDGFTLAVGHDGDAVLTVPAGRRITIQTTPG
ncbi:hypothetical protein [Nocardia asiatica]|uniref:hypothetical protein n=1 Tax=Nocardia asiatica TaxID=209252 RepID=UPI0002F85F65|nr:hypothetical protein [Nocardia asiatica]